MKWRTNDFARKYKEDDRPVLGPIPAAHSDAQREILLAEYSEAGLAWRMLTDVRFKLLALIPPVSALALTAIVSNNPILGQADWKVRVAAASFGFVITLGFWVYDTRNSELYDELISRGRRTEAELKIHTGIYRGRPEPKWKLISHGVALGLVYGSVLLAWALAGTAAFFKWVPAPLPPTP